MIRTLLATTAVATLLATGAYAQDATKPMTPAAPAAESAAPAADNAATAAHAVSGHLASNMIGESVYDGNGEDAKKIGDVNDLVIADSGAIEAVVVGVGGFLGLGEKNVALDYKEVSMAERDGDRWLVVPMSKEALEALPTFDRTVYDPAPAVTANNTTMPADGTATTTGTMPPADTAAAPADQTTVPADQTADAKAPAATDNTTSTDTMATAAIDKSQLSPLDTANATAEDLIGTTVYGANDSNVGEIGDIAMTSDGKIDAIIIDVGGFLGLGEKPVAVGMDNLSFMTDKDGDKYLYTNLTKEQLEAQPAFDKSTWAENRDSQRMIVR